MKNYGGPPIEKPISVSCCDPFAESIPIRMLLDNGVNFWVVIADKELIITE